MTHAITQNGLEQSTFQTGIFPNIPARSYHAIDAFSFSRATDFDRSPAHYKAALAFPREQTSAMLMGSAIHSLVLEHGKDVLEAPGSTRSTKIYKEFAEANPGKFLLLSDELENAKRAADSVLSHRLAKHLLSKGQPEVSAFWIDEKTGVRCKCRADYLRDDGIVVDLKTTSDGSISEFQRSIASRKYHWQSAWYLDAFARLQQKHLNAFIHLVVETKPPYAVSIYALDDAALEKAREDLSRLLERFSECLHTGEWPGYPDEIQNLSLRSWEF